MPDDHTDQGMVNGKTHPELVERLQAALIAAFADPALAETRRSLYYDGLDQRIAADYAPMRELAAYATGLGYPALR